MKKRELLEMIKQLEARVVALEARPIVSSIVIQPAAPQEPYPLPIEPLIVWDLSALPNSVTVG